MKSDKGLTKVEPARRGRQYQLDRRGFRREMDYRLAPVQDAPASFQGGPSEWVQALYVLRKHWRLSALFAFTLTVVVTAVTVLMKPVYEPVARVQVDPPGMEVFSLETGKGSGESGEYLETEAKNLQSDELAMEVVNKLRLDRVPGFVAPADPQRNDSASRTSAALRTFRTNTKVVRDPSSRLISVSVAAHDPALAATATNTLVELFIDRDYKLRADAVKQSTQWLEKQLEDIRSRMDESNRALADFQKENQIAAAGDSQTTFTEQMTELSRQLMQAQADRIQLQAYLNKFTGSASSSLPQISSNPVVQQLTQRLAEVRAQLAETLSFYGTNHPNARKLQNQADELEAQLRAQRQAILNDLRTTYTAAQAREHMLHSQIDGASQQMTILVKYNALKKEAENNTQLYNALYQKIMEAAIAAETKSSNIRVVDRARVLESPTRPRRAFNIAMALLAGIFGGVILAFVRESLETRIYTPDDMKKCVGAGSVCIVPVIGGEGASLGARLLPGSRGRSPQMFLTERPNSPEAEAVRGLYTSVRFAFEPGTPPHALLVTSALPGEGKTTLAVNLAIALAQRGPTCIVDADIRKPSVARVLRTPARQGVTDILRGAVLLEDALQRVSGVRNLTLLAAGEAWEHPAQLMTSEAMSDLLRDLRVRFDFVLLDTPPVVPFADARALSALVDGVVLIGRSGVTTREAFVRATELLQEVQSAPIVTVVLNAAEHPVVNYKYYRYYDHRRGPAA